MSRPFRSKRRAVPAHGGIRSFVDWLALDQPLAEADQPIPLIVEKLARTLEVESVFVGELLATRPERVRGVAWWKNGRHLDSVEHAVMGGLHASAVGGRPIYRSFGVARPGTRPDSYETDAIEAYAAHPLTSASGTRLGLVSGMSRSPFKDGRRVRRLLAASAPRLAGEIVRLRRQGDLHRPRAQFEIRERNLVETVRQRDVLLREVHHRVKNSLQIVASLLAMQAGATDQALVRHVLSDTAARISTVALIHAQLCETPSETSVDMRAFVQSLVRHVQHAVADSRARVSVTLGLDALTLPIQVATPCGLILSELLTNAFEHAFRHEGSGLIDVRLTARDHEATMVVRDNGPGVPQGSPHEGLGLRLVRLLAVKQLRGDVAVASRDGTEVTISFPLDPPVQRGAEE